MKETDVFFLIKDKNITSCRTTGTALHSTYQFNSH